MKPTWLACLIALPLMSNTAAAGQEEVEQCARALPQDAQVIFQNLMPKLEPGIDVRETLKSTAIGLVQSGDIERSNARQNAMAVVNCLQLMQNQ